MERDRFIDTIRVLAVLVVVFGHWTATSVTWDGGVIVGDSALALVPESHLATGLLQVMPRLCFIGGVANARCYSLLGTYLSYLQTRLRRLLSPTLVFIALWIIVAALAEVLPLPDPNLVDRGADIAALPFWFVGLYVIVVSLAPAMLTMHKRWRWRVPFALVCGAITVDVLVYGLGLTGLGVANYAFVWLLPHQLGFFYAERLPVGRATLWASAASGFTALVLLTTIGGYPVSMIFVPGAERGNTEPPSFAIVAVVALLLAGALLAKPWVESYESRWLTRLNRVPLSLYLWHVSAIPIAVAIIYPLGFPQHGIGSAGWWLWRVVWLLVLAAVLAAIVTAVARFEIHPEPAAIVQAVPDPRRIPVALIGVVLVAISLLGFGVTGFNRPLTDTGEGLLGFTMNPALNSVHLIIGVTVLAVALVAGSAVLSSVAVGGALLLAIGVAGIQDGLSALGSNTATSTMEAVIGAVLVLASIPRPVSA